MKDYTICDIVHRTTFFALLFLGLVLIAGCSPHSVNPVSVVPDCISESWPHDQSDLEPDPAILFGRLDNNLRYVLLRNSEPRNRVGLFLNVQSGSIHETEKQRGVAHYLEHMLFNGTTHYPPGTLVDYFQSIGMGFGADTNAHTGYDETVYKLILPSGTTEMLDEGIQVLADYAAGALLLESEVDRERGIILAEKRARDSIASRVRKKQLQFDFSGTLIAERDPIGTEEVLHKADSALLRSYYQRWYRPRNMVVVIVGDMDVASAEEMVKKHFSSLDWETLPVTCPEIGVVAEGGTDVLYLHEPDLGHTSLALGTVFNQPESVDTVDRERKHLHEYVAGSILGNRLEKIKNRKGSPFTATRVYGGTFLQRFGYATLTAVTDEKDWEQGVVLLKETLDQAIASGLTGRELQRVKKELTAYLEKQVQTSATRNSMEIASSIIRKLNSEEVILSPEQELQLYGPMLEQMTLEDADRALGRLWGNERRLVQVVGTARPVADGITPERYILNAFTRPSGKPELAWQEETVAAFPYLPVPEDRGRLVREIQHDDIALEELEYSGGVRVNIKQTDFQENQVMVAVHFGHGKLSEPRPGMAKLGESVVRESGVGRLTREQLKETLAGTNASLEFNIGGESFSFSGNGLSNELELLLQLVYTRLHDPAFRQLAFDQAKQRILQVYEQMENTVEGRQRLGGEKFLYGNNPYFTMASREQVMDITFEEVVDWLKPAFLQAPLEISVVGDIDPVEVKALVAEYFGHEQRVGQKTVLPEGVMFPEEKRFVEHVDSTVDKALVTVAWKTDDFWDISRTRRLNALASVIDNRLRIKVREELGATYSPVVYNHSSRTHNGFGVMRVQLVVAPEQADEMTRIVRKTVAVLEEEMVSREELQRSLEPTLTSIRDFQRTNGYWLNNVMGLSSRNPQQLQWPLTIVSDFQAINPEDLRQLAKQYLQKDAAIELVVTTGPVK